MINFGVFFFASVLVTETSHDGRYYVGHNEHYEQILVPKREELMGKLFPVRIVDVSKFSMIGKGRNFPLFIVIRVSDPH
jgi:hypothetical protein